ncbi:MAG TPA: ISKra4 family transposase [Firmicutes bacterium]|nr:ISKra4 family transposase [Bacillota bacterium]
MNARTHIILEITELTNRLFEETETGRDKANLHDLEDATSKAASRIAQILLEGMLDEFGDGYCDSRIPCKCGGKLRFVGRRELTITTICGEVHLKRAYYHCKRCGASWVPLDERLGLSGCDFSEGVVEKISYCCAELPFESASEMMERLTGIAISTKEAQILSEGIGREMGKELEIRAEVAMKDGIDSDSRPERLYVAIDGVMLQDRDGWHEVEVGSVYDTVKVTNARGEEEEVANTVTHVAVRGTPDDFTPQLCAETQVRGEEHAKEIIALGDGAFWIWNIVNSYFPEAVQIIDWYHASEHVWSLGRVLYEDDEQRCRDWVDQGLELLKEGKVEELISRLKTMEGLCDEAASERDRLVKYLEDNRNRMRYDEYLARGYHIGSGVVESACKNVVQIRHKRPGMRWSTAGAQEVLNLRVFLLNGRWDRFWRERRGKALSRNQGLALPGKAA